MGIASQAVHGAGMCFIPHERNNYHPFALKHGLLAFVSALLIASKALALTLVAITPTTADLSTITVNRIVQLTNAERTKAGLNELAVNAKLAAAAKQKGEHILKEDYFAHISPSGVTPWFWMSKNEYAYSVAGENLAIDFTEAEDVVAAWIASPTHKENMLLPQYTETGVAVVTGEFQGGTSIVVVHMFGKPAVAAAQTPTDVSSAIKAQVSGQTETALPPTPTPAPPSPTPTPVPVDKEPPAVPRIAAGSEDGLAGERAVLRVAGEVGSIVYFSVNGLEVAKAEIIGDTEQPVELDLSGAADGEVRVTAYAEDAAGNRSESAALALIKDTSGPLLASENVRLILLPTIDEPRALVKMLSDDAASYKVAKNGEESIWPAGETIILPLSESPVTLAARDAHGNAGHAVEVSLTPVFASDANTDYVAPPARFSRASRWLAAIFSVIILILLSIAVLVRIRIQRPALIVHAGAVAVLAMVVFLI